MINEPGTETAMERRFAGGHIFEAGKTKDGESKSRQTLEINDLADFNRAGQEISLHVLCCVRIDKARGGGSGCHVEGRTRTERGRQREKRKQQVERKWNASGNARNLDR